MVWFIRRSAGLLGRDHSPPQEPAPPQDATRSIPQSLYHACSAGRPYLEYRARNLAILNRHFDHVLAVSNRVSEIAVRHGDANNHHLPQRALGHVCPVEDLAQWQLKQPELFVSGVSNLPGLDTKKGLEKMF